MKSVYPYQFPLADSFGSSNDIDVPIPTTVNSRNSMAAIPANFGSDSPCDLENIYYNAPKSPPERYLLAAILERAWKDLEDIVDPQDRRDAIRWFRIAKKDHSKCRYESLVERRDCRFTFKEVTDYLELSAWQIETIYKKVECAEQLERSDRCAA